MNTAATRGRSANFTGDGVAPEQVFGRGVTWNFFPVLGVTPLMGRFFTEEEDRNGAQVVVISYALWQRHWNGDPNILGKEVLMNGSRYSVIAVMRPVLTYKVRRTPDEEGGR